MSEGEEELNVGAVRLEEVASAANVSLSTASKALRGKPHVSEKTRIRVIDAAQRLGYSTAEAMASMARLSVRDSHGMQDFRVGIIGVDMKGVFSPTILIGAENAFQARSAAALLFNASGNEALFHSGIERMLVQGVSGLLIISRCTDPVPYYVDSPVPVVYAYGPSRDPDDCSVAQDNVESGCLAVRHLLSCGRTRIAIIAGDSEYSVTHERMRGALKALHDAGLQLAGEARFGPWEAEWGRAAARLLLNDGAAFDAVICQNDVLARGCIEELERNGCRVPQDVAVIGHDNSPDYVSYAHPLLTSIDDNNEMLGRQAALCLLDAIAGHPHHGVERVPVKLIQRESTLPLD